MHADRSPLTPAWPQVDAYDLSHRSRELDLERLTHLVLVDGRLVDVWSEPVTGTRWQEHADRFDRERQPAVVPAPAPPLYVQVLAWLDAAVGGRDHLLSLHSGPLVDDGFEPDPDLRPARRELLATTVDLLDQAAGEFLALDARAVLMNTLRAAWEVDPETVLEMGDAAKLAGGVCWLAAKANGLLGAGGVTTQAALQDVVGCRSPLSVPGRTLHQLISGYWPDPIRPPTLPDLLLVGRAELLTRATRRRLVRARDQALAAQAVVTEVPSEVTPG